MTEDPMGTVNAAPDDPALVTALADVREVLERDGFLARWDVDAERGVHFQVLAGTAACHDCLVPAVVMEAILGDALDQTPYALSSLTLPSRT